MIVSALLLAAAAPQFVHQNPGTGPTVMPRRRGGQRSIHTRSATSRVGEWTFDQRLCERRRNGSCVMTAPDLVQATADKPRD